MVIPISEQTLTSEATAPRLSFSIGLVTLCRLAEVRATYHHKSSIYESILNVSNMMTKNLLRSVEVRDLGVWVVAFGKHYIMVGGHKFLAPAERQAAKIALAESPDPILGQPLQGAWAPAVSG
jgi:hypothetical protein